MPNNSSILALKYLFNFLFKGGFYMPQNSGRMSPSEVKAQLKNSDTTMLQMLHFVFDSVLKRKSLLFLNIGLLLIIAGLNFIVPQFTKNIIDHALGQHDLSTLWFNVGGLLGTTILLGLLSFTSTYMMQILSQQSIKELRLTTYTKILKQDYAFFQNSKTGDLMVRLTSDINNLQSLISSDSLGLVGNTFTFVVVLVFLYLQNCRLALLVSLTFPILFITIRFFRSRIREAFSNVRTMNSQISNQLQATLTEIELIKSYTTEHAETKTFADIVDKTNTYTLEATKWQAIFQPLLLFINTSGTAIVLAFGGYLVVKGQMTIGDLVAYLSYVTILQNPINSFSRLINIFQTAQVSYDRIHDVMAFDAAIIEPTTPSAFPEPLVTSINFKDVSFQYELKTADALEHITCQIPAGKTTALVGRSGAGKSTLIRLLMRLYDATAGTITFDGQPITAIATQDLRRHISLVSQDVIIVDGTIGDNIAYGTPNATQEMLWHAAKQADIADFINELPDGMTTAVGERGIKLSGGQKQRLSIARALLKDAPIVILDEATAALDNESEKTIQHALDNLMTAKTSIVIAHRLSTVHNADQILVMDHGQIVERGTHSSLLAQKDGVYRKLYDAQFE